MQDVSINLEPVDLVFCDTITISMVRSRRKVHYRLIASDCLGHLAASLGQYDPSAREKFKKRNFDRLKDTNEKKNHCGIKGEAIV